MSDKITPATGIARQLSELKERAQKQLAQGQPSEFALKNHSPGPWEHCSASDGQCKCRQIWSIPEDANIVTAKPIACVHHEWGDGPKYIYGELSEVAVRANAELLTFAWKIPLWLDRIEAQQAKNERLSQTIYCPKCGSCGETGCCDADKCVIVGCIYGKENVKAYRDLLDEIDEMRHERDEYRTKYMDLIRPTKGSRL